MFTPLTSPTASRVYSVHVWVDSSGVRPFDLFLEKLRVEDIYEAFYFVESLEYMMERGELALAGSIPTERDDRLRYNYASKTWFIYFYEPPILYLCDQGLKEPWESNVETAYDRMLVHTQQPIQQTMKKIYVTA